MSIHRRQRAGAPLEHRIDCGGAIIECRERGAGPAVVLLPAGGCHFDYLDPLAEALATAGWRAVSINQRGAGDSVGAVDGITLHDLAADVATVLERLRTGPAHVIGHAFGNRVARCLAADRPERVRSLVLLAAGGQVPADEDTLEAARHLVRCDLSDAQWQAALAAVYLSPGSDAGLVQCLGQTPTATRIQAAAGRATADTQWQDGGSAPMLILQGLDDRMAPPANGYALRERLGRRVRLVDVPGAGHLLVLEQPEVVMAQVSTFLRDPVHSAISTAS